ncbi:hypothetical protein KC963_02990 [Candidatus Saccharibacteria bacterium]|nr:hypothetical protein [Candidatus Saccharibacteria bacterium]
MSVPKSVEPEPYYMSPGRGEVWDARFVLTNLAPVIPKPEYIFPSEPVQLFDMPQAAEKRGEGFTNGLTPISYAGCDGEISSGFIEMLRVESPDSDTVAAIHSWQFYHESGLPVGDSSWMCEFNDESVARALWAQKRGMPFSMEDAQSRLNKFVREFPDAADGIIGFSKLGLLRPWFKQRSNKSDVRVGNHLFGGPEFRQADPSLQTGRVYHLPERPWYSNRISSYTAKTCLGSLLVKEQSDFMGPRVERVAVQWDDGSITRYGEADELPAPLTTRLVKKPK